MASNVNSNSTSCEQNHENGHDIGVEEMDITEESLATARSSSVDTQFDEIIGHIEDIFIEPEFQSLQNDFLDENYHHFDDTTDENKLIYTQVHQEYTQLVETFLMNELRMRMPEFDMTQFIAEITSRKKELEGEVFEVLLTFTDFVAFKELIIDHKKSREGRVEDLSGGITVTSFCCPSNDIDMGLMVTGMSIVQPQF